jgi:hypothetical protein
MRVAAALAGLLACPVFAGHPTVIEAPPGAKTAIERALKALPRRPARISVVGEDYVSPETRSRFRRAEAFVSKGRPVVYVTSHSPMLKAAQDGSTLHVHGLAAVIWHEMAHLDGAGESEAREREQALWTSFVRDDKVDRLSGLRYLKLLAERPRPSP